MKLFALAALLLVFVSHGPQNQQKDPCQGETTAEMKMCAAKRYKQADDELNVTYRRLMAKLEDAGHRTSLKAAQQNWLKYRDSNCDFESYLNRGGSIYSVIVGECMISMTESRTKELKQEIDNLDQ